MTEPAPSRSDGLVPDHELARGLPNPKTYDAAAEERAEAFCSALNAIVASAEREPMPPSTSEGLGGQSAASAGSEGIEGRPEPSVAGGVRVFV